MGAAISTGIPVTDNTQGLFTFTKTPLPSDNCVKVLWGLPGIKTPSGDLIIST